MESVRVQLEEESEARLDIERQLVKANGEVQVWRSKYETEANARAEEVINKKEIMTHRISIKKNLLVFDIGLPMFYFCICRNIFHLKPLSFSISSQYM